MSYPNIQYAAVYAFETIRNRESQSSSYKCVTADYNQTFPETVEHDLGTKKYGASRPEITLELKSISPRNKNLKSRPLNGCSANSLRLEVEEIEITPQDGIFEFEGEYKFFQWVEKPGGDHQLKSGTRDVLVSSQNVGMPATTENTGASPTIGGQPEINEVILASFEGVTGKVSFTPQMVVYAEVPGLKYVFGAIVTLMYDKSWWFNLRTGIKELQWRRTTRLRVSA
ncbi:hypothetical protein C8R46DRAFT_1036036 [Mycena filopes]|nr:hypothetical protein C8R46DRAFT_1036036 [Mycena filopes]